MAKCTLCHLEMRETHGCTVGTIHIGEKLYNRIPVGGPGDFGENEGADYVCGDCGAPQGGFHHFGCDEERCPACGQQLISCECADVFIEEGLHE